MTQISIVAIESKESSYGFRSYGFAAHKYLLDFNTENAMPICLGMNLNGAPIGLILGKVLQEGKVELLSIYITPEHRKKQNGAFLLTRWLDYAKTFGFDQVFTTYMTNQKFSDPVQNLLMKVGFQEPTLRNLLIQYSSEGIANCNWVNTGPLPKNYKVVPWTEVSQEQKDELARHNAQSNWIDPILDPILYEDGIEPRSSTAMLVDGNIRGWCLIHVVHNILRVTCCFAHPTLQRMARVTHLFRHMFLVALELNIDVAMWMVPVDQARMYRFAKQYQLPGAQYSAETYGTSKVL